MSFSNKALILKPNLGKISRSHKFRNFLNGERKIKKLLDIVKFESKSRVRGIPIIEESENSDAKSLHKEYIFV